MLYFESRCYSVITGLPLYWKICCKNRKEGRKADRHNEREKERQNKIEKKGYIERKKERKKKGKRISIENKEAKCGKQPRYFLFCMIYLAHCNMLAEVGLDSTERSKSFLSM